ncbi:AF4/FMR2 family member lilli [Drosophila grimshawi]|uniref:GH19013 n=1 Tax=Drosophila grimshawi TaxID=7222 RepID=B4JHY7_DROGR|nr:AF4/FMR2 family member lilli [Drosophila grimshawi]EDV92895.1 GH19013 [Drosophila grimshawi]
MRESFTGKYVNTKRNVGMKIVGANAGSAVVVGVGVGVGVSVGSGSRYKVTARCVPEVSITSPTSLHQQQQQQQQQQQNQHHQQQQQQHDAPNKHITLLRSRSQPTSNSIFSPGLGLAVGSATLVEEEDFTLLTAELPVLSGSGKNVLQRQLATTTQLEEKQQEELDQQQQQQQSIGDIGEVPNELTPLVEEHCSAAATITANPTTTNRYSHNSKTTRSWPVIYRNPQHCDYEALYVQQQQQQQQQQQSSQSFKQNCYSNQFKQSIVYSSSNEELPGGPELTELAPRQTTCYYFAPSRHNSIYEHPSSVVGGSLQFDAAGNAATTAAAAAAVESLRRSNSILLRQNSCAKVIQRRGSGSAAGGGAALDTSTSLSSHMDGLGMGSGTGASACCSSCCMGPPPVLFLFVTLLMTTSATAMLCAAIMTDHWEHVTWDRNSLDRYSNRSGLHLEWLLDEQVAMLKPDKRADHRFRRDSVFLVPMHGGIWTLCIDLPMQQLQELRRNPKFPRGAPPCVNYLAGSMENARGEEQRNDWQHSESQAITLQPHLSTYWGRNPAPTKPNLNPILVTHNTFVFESNL